MDHLCLFCPVFVMPLCKSVYLYLVVTYWERAGRLVLVCVVSLEVCHFRIGILGQVCWLYRFLIFALLLTFYKSWLNSSVMLKRNDLDVFRDNNV